MLFVPLCFASSSWSRLDSEHFQAYVQGDIGNARQEILWLERFRTVFASPGLITRDLSAKDPSRVRLIQFSSAADYESFRLNPTADAYYVGEGGRDLIVMPGSSPQQSAVAAHEYSHAVFHAAGLKLPSCLNEGLAEVFSNARLNGSRWEFGGPLDDRIGTLRRHKLLPLHVLFSAQPSSALRQSRDGDALFYAESWALADLLVTSPAYGPHLHSLILSLNSGAAPSRALTVAYAKSIDGVESDLSVWIHSGRFTPVSLPAIAPAKVVIETTALDKLQVDSVLAQLLLAQGQLDRAQAAFEHLAVEAPQDPDIFGALGAIALARGNKIAAVHYWKSALDRHLRDPDLCFRYALLAEEANLDSAEIRLALNRAISLQPDFDDARYHLALLDNNTGDFTDALIQLQNIHTVPETRAYHYWTAIAYAEEQLGNRDEAMRAAEKALAFAKTPEDRVAANQIAYAAQTDFAVQFVQDRDGTAHLVSTRIPHGTTDWNPFVQPDDRLVKIDGRLADVQCSGGQLTGFVISTGEGSLSLLVVDPKRVLMRNSPQEFTCGPQDSKPVRIEYAANRKDQSHAGLLRGMEFR